MNNGFHIVRKGVLWNLVTRADFYLMFSHIKCLPDEVFCKHLLFNECIQDIYRLIFGLHSGYINTCF